MKTRFKYLALMATALLVGFSSCSNDEDGGKPDSGTPISLFLKISSDAPASYAEGAVQGAAPVTFTSGNLYFTDGFGNIKQHYTITTGATTTTNISMSALTGAGETIQNLPGDVSAVYVVGNTSGLPTSGNISTVKAAALQVQTQGTITNVNLYGEVTTLTSTGTDTYTCTVNLAPTVARIELTNIKASGVITGFKVAGIFVDNYYSQAAVNGTVAAGNLVNNGAVVAAFDDNSTQYPTALKPSIYDWYTTPLAASSLPATATTVTGSVWGYNVFATAAGSAVPRIVIRLTDITATAGSGINYSTDQFITITGFKKAGTSLTAIKAGEVYNIGAGLTFDETDLTPTPNMATIDVEVKVTLASWLPVTVTPEL